MSTAKRTTVIILIISIIATLAFIFGSSMRTPEETMKDSEAVGGVVADIVPPETEVGGFLETNLRKIAHFTEYSLLAAEVMLLLIVISRLNLTSFISSVFFGFLVGLLDETVQISSGRGSSVTDVWLDGFGYIVASFAIALVYGFICLIGKICKR